MEGASPTAVGAAALLSSLIMVLDVPDLVLLCCCLPQVEAVTDRMPEAAVNLHGTRCVQKVVEVRRVVTQKNTSVG